MKAILPAACAALALAACGQPAAPAPEAPPPPQSLLEQVRAETPEMQMVSAVAQLQGYQRAHPDSQPVCRNVRSTESHEIIPENVAPDSIYAAHAGSLVISVQCGELRSLAAFDPREHWLVVVSPGAAEATIVNCADERGVDRCPRRVPVIEAPATTTPASGP
jgi:hypothetical protein